MWLLGHTSASDVIEGITVHRNSPMKSTELNCDNLTKVKTSRQIKESMWILSKVLWGRSIILLCKSSSIQTSSSYPLANQGTLLYTLYINIGLIHKGCAHYWATRLFTVEIISSCLGYICNTGKDLMFHLSSGEAHEQGTVWKQLTCLCTSNQATKGLHSHLEPSNKNGEFCHDEWCEFTQGGCEGTINSYPLLRH